MEASFSQEEDKNHQATHYSRATDCLQLMRRQDKAYGTLAGYFAARALADGYLMAFNSYDSRIYTFGKGPSKTTITAPDVGVTTGTPITLTGSVIDLAAGTQQDRVASNYPNGLPAVSDESMSEWMEYVYMQKAFPLQVDRVHWTLTYLGFTVIATFAGRGLLFIL